MDKIQYNGLWFHYEVDNYELYFSLNISEDILSEKVWECTLRGLWRDEFERETIELKKVWDMHVTGDYFQQTLHKHNKELHPHISYTSWFHDMIRENRESFSFINNIYSTSRIAGFIDYPVSSESINFWEKQVDKGLAIYIEQEQRFKALI